MRLSIGPSHLVAFGVGTVLGAALVLGIPKETNLDTGFENFSAVTMTPAYDVVAQWVLVAGAATLAVALAWAFTRRRANIQEATA